MLDQGYYFLADKFEYSHYMLAGLCVDVIGRSYMLITYGSFILIQDVTKNVF